MAETIQDYFRRFDPSVTESLYSHFTFADFERNKAVNEFLDYDRESLFRQQGQHCGIRNIDNSCYLSVTLQILYNIQALREKIFRIPEGQGNKFLLETQKLFAMMSKGSLKYVDPTGLFLVLKKLHPSVFVSGAENDFHEVFTLILDELQKSFTAEEDRRFLKKLFYGKTKIEIVGQSKSGINAPASDPGNSFNLINLSSQHGEFEKALRQYKSESIDGYVNERGDLVNAERCVHFLETPGILSFFINRVSYRDKKLQKDCSEFKFEHKIHFSKTTGSRASTHSDEELERQQTNLREWVASIEKSRAVLAESLKYFEAKEFEDMNTPSIDNPLEDSLRDKVKPYLKCEIQQIEAKIKQATHEIEDLEKKRIQLAEDNYSELYHLWAIMIHAGRTADSGHYKMCVKTDENGEWVEFNDRRTELITLAKIDEYKQRGEICCLFYRRSSLISKSEVVPIPSSLKKLVKEQENDLFARIDNARILQALYQEYESASMIWEFESLNLRQGDQASAYFFKPLLHLLKVGAPQEVCKGYILYELISAPRFAHSLRLKFLNPDKELTIPKIDFKIPREYFDLAEGFKDFLLLEPVSPLEAYDLISFYMDLTIADNTLLAMFQRLREVIVLKGIFYECLLAQCEQPAYEQISKSVDRIMSTLRVDDQCMLVNVPLREEIRRKYLLKQKSGQGPSGTLEKVEAAALSKLRDNLPGLFASRFDYWIKLRERMVEIDESLLREYEKLSKKYIRQSK